jgi:hypothetical protein
MALDVSSLLNTMLTQAKAGMTTGWNTVQPFAKTQFTAIAQQIVDIESQLKDGSVTKDAAALLLDMQKNASRAALMTIQGIGLITAQNILNGALGAVATAVNKALGFALL